MRFIKHVKAMAGKKMTQLSNVVNIYKSHEKPIHIRNDSPRLTAAFAQAQSLKYISINFWNLIFFISFV